MKELKGEDLAPNLLLEIKEPETKAPCFLISDHRDLNPKVQKRKLLHLHDANKTNPKTTSYRFFATVLRTEHSRRVHAAIFNMKGFKMLQGLSAVRSCHFNTFTYIKKPVIFPSFWSRVS